MSRTDKDAPYKIRASEHPEKRERHWGCDGNVQFRQDIHAQWRGYAVECDIDGEQQNCYYVIPHKCDTETEDRRTGYYKPERAYSRSVLRQAVDDYNTFGYTDIEPEPTQHHHAPWGGGYWD